MMLHIQLDVHSRPGFPACVASMSAADVDIRIDVPLQKYQIMKSPFGSKLKRVQALIPVRNVDVQYLAMLMSMLQPSYR